MYGERGAMPLTKTVKVGLRLLKKLKIELPYDPAIALLGIYPRDTDNAVSKGHTQPNVYSSTINNSQSMEMSIDG